MNKGIDKTRIIEVTLELINREGGVQGVNLRQIARLLSCAHTNLYNYFSDGNELLWAALDEAGVKLREFVLAGLDQIEDPGLRMSYYYSRLLDFYLKNKGWFRLFWLEPISSKRPQNSIDATVFLVDRLVGFMQEIFLQIYGEEPDRQTTTYIVHNVHCYLYGEVSIFLAGRGLIQDEAEFKKYVTEECSKLSRLLFFQSGRPPVEPDEIAKVS